ncbi:MAG: DUF503 domain-containing protein [Phycisphaerae bacterium]
MLKAELMLYDAWSLKDKRSVIQGVTQRLRDRFNVSVAEIGHRDAPQRCTLGIAVVSSDTRSAHARLDKMVELLRSHRQLSLIEYERAFV